MAVSAKRYGKADLHAYKAEVHWLNDSVKVILVANTYTPDQDAHEYRSDVTGELASANGYTAGGVVLANRTASYDPTTNTVKLDADDVTWTVPDGGTLTARYAVLFKDTGTASTSPLLAYVDFGTDQTSSASGTTAPFTIQWDANGILNNIAA